MDVSAQRALGIVRVLKLSFLVAGAMFIFLVIRIPARPATAPSSAVEIAISVVALMCVVAGFFVPTLIRMPAAPRLPGNSTSAPPINQWFARCILSLAFLDACNIFAVVLHFLGARVQFVELVFAIGMLSLIFWSPGTPPSADQNLIG
jgi:hypothetical protein